jgi:hypothetical protein
MSLIPKMTHPLSSAWDQPDHSTFLFDDTHVLMSKKAFDELKEYSCSQPTGVYDGKMWKTNEFAYRKSPDGRKESWLLKWYGPCDNSEMCRTYYREILLVG